MTVMTVTGGAPEVSGVLSRLLQQFTPRPAKEIPSPDTTAYQYETKGTLGKDGDYALVLKPDDTFCITQGKGAARRTILILPDGLDWDSATALKDTIVEAFKTGTTIGFEDGWMDGFDEGWDSGKKIGYKQGLTDAMPSPRETDPA